MKLETVGEVIAVRKLQLSGEPSSEILVKLGKPQPFPDSPEADDFYCPFQITGAGDERVRYAAGVDGFQAIELTVKLIGVVLSKLSRELNGRLRWECDENGGIGFPGYPES
jgi:hypothetical protein